MAAPVFYRHARVEHTYVALMEPQQPSKRLQGKLEMLGFVLDENDGRWWSPLEHLGRSNMSLKALTALLSSHGVNADVRDAPSGDVEEEVEAAEEEVEKGALQAAIDRHIFPRAYEMFRKLQSFETQVATLQALVARLAGPSAGEAGRSILVKDPGSVHLMDGRRVFIDLARGCPVLERPEERVRQCVLQHLISHLGFPVHLLDSELRLANSSDRADIVVRWTAEDGSDQFLAVIECKEPGVPLNDDVRDQAKRYATKLKAPYLAITDGSTLNTWVRASEGADWRAVDGFPSFQMLQGHVSPAGLVSPARSIERPEFDLLDDPFLGFRYIEEAAIHELNEFLINFASLFLDAAAGPAGLEFDGWRCTQDRQLVMTSFGNAGYKSHAYHGAYRSLLLAHPQRGEVLTFYRTFSTRSSPKAEPVTMLALGIHHVEEGRRHHAAQLNLRDALHFGDNLAEVIHTGRVSKGGGGSFKQADIVARVAAQAPDMIVDGKIHLGRLPTDRLVTWEDAFPLLVRLLRFALAVDGLRTGAD